MRHPNRSWRVDETYIRVAGKWTYLYRAIDSAGNTIDFLLSPKRDLIAAKGFLQLALCQVGQNRPRVINVDGHPAYSAAIDQLKRSGELGRNCRCRRSLYLNNAIEQDHRFVKKRVVASQGFRSVDGALNTIAGYEAINIIRKGQIRWLPKGDIVGQTRFIERMFGIAV
jgi:IS6 family transposase